MAAAPRRALLLAELEQPSSQIRGETDRRDQPFLEPSDVAKRADP